MYLFIYGFAIIFILDLHAQRELTKMHFATTGVSD